MRGIITLATGGGALPPRKPSGDGGKGEASFRKSGGSVRFKAGASSSGAAKGGTGGNSPGAIFKSAVTCASLGIVGDFIAQSVGKRQAAAAAGSSSSSSSSSGGKKNKGTATSASDSSSSPGYDFARTARQCAYNFVFYGPLQHFWYAALAVQFPMTAGAPLATNLSPFAVKVFLNQAVLGPVVVSTFFAWSMALQGQMDAYSSKIKRDMYPTLQRGWKFWVPAASVNFAVVPVRFQILYMSTCSIVWNYILSQGAGKAI